jgi:hypothetical protein
MSTPSKESETVPEVVDTVATTVATAAATTATAVAAVTAATIATAVIEEVTTDEQYIVIPTTEEDQYIVVTEETTTEAASSAEEVAEEAAVAAVSAVAEASTATTSMTQKQFEGIFTNCASCDYQASISTTAGTKQMFESSYKNFIKSLVNDTFENIVNVDTVLDVYYGIVPLHLVLRLPYNEDTITVVKKLIEKGASVNYKDRLGRNAAVYFISQNQKCDDTTLYFAIGKLINIDIVTEFSLYSSRVKKMDLMKLYEKELNQVLTQLKDKNFENDNIMTTVVNINVTKKNHHVNDVFTDFGIVCEFQKVLESVLDKSKCKVICSIDHNCYSKPRNVLGLLCDISKYQ